jgi:DNA-3-methyladenine glycosylase
MRRLPRSFYARPTLEVAPDLLGKVLVHRTAAGRTAGIIVEVEAYVGESDPACHAAPGPTKRNAPMYGEPGHAYVYLNYGVHYLMNVVTEPELSPAAILIRALEPLEGIELMRRRRRRLRTMRQAKRADIPDHELCRGPGNVTHAMGIALSDTGIDLLGNKLYIEDRGHSFTEISWSPRIGINVGVEHPWRCYAAGHVSVSGTRSSTKTAGRSTKRA